MEVPIPKSLPGNLNEGDEQTLWLTQLMHLTPTRFTVPQHAVVNTAEGYMVYFPDTWVDWVAVLRDDEAATWQFFLMDPETGEAVTELLRIQATTGSGEASGTAGNYIDLGHRGSRYFTGYIPRTPASAENMLAITEAELQELFQIIS